MGLHLIFHLKNNRSGYSLDAIDIQFFPIKDTGLFSFE